MTMNLCGLGRDKLRNKLGGTPPRAATMRGFVRDG